MATIEKQNESNELVQLVSFMLGKEQFGLSIMIVQEIIRSVSITKMPNSPDFVEGIINLRGKVIPVVSLRKKLGMEEASDTESTKILVVEINEMVIGFVVDEVSEVLRISKSTIDPAPAVAGINSSYITGVGKLDDGLVILIDMENVLTSDEKKALEEVN